MPAQFRLRLLGLPTATDDASSMMPKKARVLLARLLLAPHPLRRSAILPLLWPTATEAHARGSLRVTLHTIRQTLGPEALRTDRHQVALHQAPPTDLQAFLDAIRQGDDASAVRHYGGPLLADVALYDTMEGDLWLEAERRRLARLFEGAARRALQPTATAALPATARLAVARRLRDSHPEQVPNWALLLDLVSRLGSLEQLLQEQTALEARLASGELSDVRAAQALLSSHRAPVGTSVRARAAASIAVVDSRSSASRGEALRALETDWTRVTLGTRSCLLVTGQAGIGKSVLLSALQHRLAGSAAAVTAVRAPRSARDLPFALLRDVVHRLTEQPGALQLHTASARALAALDGALAERFGIGNPPAPPQDTPESVGTLVRAVRDLLRQVAAEAPSALLLDDLHWADPFSRRILRRAAVAVADAPLLVIATARVPLGPAWLGWPRLHLLPLPTPEARVLAEHVAPSLSSGIIECLLERAGGVPLRLLHGARLAEELAEASHTFGGGVTTTLRDDVTWREGPVATRLRKLMEHAPDTVPLLAALALWDAPLQTVELASVALPTGSNTTHDLVRARLGPLRDLVTQVSGDRWRLAHDSVTDAVLRIVSPHTLHGTARNLVRHFRILATARRDLQQVRRLAGGYAALAIERTDRTAAHVPGGEAATTEETASLFPTSWPTPTAAMTAHTARPGVAREL